MGVALSLTSLTGMSHTFKVCENEFRASGGRSLDKQGQGFRRQESLGSIKPKPTPLGISPKDCELLASYSFLQKCSGC